MILIAKKWLMGLTILAFLAGIFCGITFEYIVNENKLKAKQLNKQLGYNKNFLLNMTEELNLSQTQVQAIGGVLRLEAPRIVRTSLLFKGTIQRIRKETIEKIEEHLKGDQKQQFIDFLRKSNYEDYFDQ